MKTGKTKTAKRTPGPWVADVGGWPIIINVDAPKDNPEIICTIDEGDGSDGAKAGDDERVANARLVAASPDYDAAARELLRAWDAGEDLDLGLENLRAIVKRLDQGAR